MLVWATLALPAHTSLAQVLEMTPTVEQRLAQLVAQEPAQPPRSHRARWKAGGEAGATPIRYMSYVVSSATLTLAEARVLASVLWLCVFPLQVSQILIALRLKHAHGPPSERSRGGRPTIGAGKLHEKLKHEGFPISQSRTRKLLGELRAGTVSRFGIAGERAFALFARGWSTLRRTRKKRKNRVGLIEG